MGPVPIGQFTFSAQQGQIPLGIAFLTFCNENFFYMQVEFRQLFCLSADNFFIPLSLLIMNELARRGMVSYAK